MSTDAFGPANAANSVTVEPADSRVFGPSDTFFQDCSPGQQNGTAYGASFFNFILQMMRGAIRGQNIAINNSNASMLLQAIQVAAPPYAVDTGTAGALVVNVNQAGFALNPGTRIRVKVANTVPGATAIALTNSAGPTTSFGTLNLVRPDGSALNTYDLVANQVADLTFDGTQFQIERPAIGGSTGDVVWAIAGASKAGFFPLNGFTIGDGSSGASGVAGVLAQSLFGFLYTNFSRTLCPLNGSDLGSAAANFAAHRTIQLPDWRCKALVGVDAMGGSGTVNALSGVPVTAGGATTPGSTLGEALHTMASSEMPVHSHGVTDPTHAHAQEGDTMIHPGSGSFGAANGGFLTGLGGTTGAAATGISIQNAGSGAAHNNTPLSVTAVAFVRL